MRVVCGAAAVMSWGWIVWAYGCTCCSIGASTSGDRFSAAVTLLGPCLWAVVALAELREEMPEDDA